VVFVILGVFLNVNNDGITIAGGTLFIALVIFPFVYDLTRILDHRHYWRMARSAAPPDLQSYLLQRHRDEGNQESGVEASTII